MYISTLHNQCITTIIRRIYNVTNLFKKKQKVKQKIKTKIQRYEANKIHSPLASLKTLKKKRNQINELASKNLFSTLSLD